MYVSRYCKVELAVYRHIKVLFSFNIPTLYKLVFVVFIEINNFFPQNRLVRNLLKGQFYKYRLYNALMLSVLR